MIPVFERPKTVHASDHAATVIGKTNFTRLIFGGVRCKQIKQKKTIPNENVNFLLQIIKQRHIQ
jgi:hypothetical protein